MRSIAFGMAAALGVVMVAAPALAQTEIDTIVIEIDRTVRGAEGSITTVAVVTVDPSLIGATCTGTAETGNNASEHPNNDFIITSGASTTLIPDWEREAGAIVTTSTTLLLGETISIALRLGPRGVSSGMVVVTLSCAQPEPPPATTTTSTTTTTTTTTTLPPSPTTTTTPPPRAATTTTTQGSIATTTTTALGPTTTEPPPVGGVSAGGGSTTQINNDAAWWLGGGALVSALALLLSALAWRQATGPDEWLRR